MDFGRYKRGSMVDIRGYSVIVHFSLPALRNQSMEKHKAMFGFCKNVTFINLQFISATYWILMLCVIHAVSIFLFFGWFVSTAM